LNTSTTVTVTLIVLPPYIFANPSPVTATSSGGSIPAPQQVGIFNLGPGSFNFTAAASVLTPANGTWLSVSPASGSSGGNITVAFAPAGLAAGTYTGTITITSAGLQNSPYSIPVTLNVTGISSNQQKSPAGDARIELTADTLTASNPLRLVAVAGLPDFGPQESVTSVTFNRVLPMTSKPSEHNLQLQITAHLDESVRHAFWVQFAGEKNRLAPHEDAVGGSGEIQIEGP
jgi:hypothetical protein